jgi:membrane protein implicated in regulation of membrane protease activity
MGIGVSLFLLAVGAILTFATDVTVSGLNLDTVGLVLMLVGAVSFVLTLIVWSSRRRVVRTAPAEEVVERRAVAPRREVVEERRVTPPRGEVVTERRYRDPDF